MTAATLHPVAPASSHPPTCYGNFRGRVDEMCDTCGHRRGCRQARAATISGQTVLQAALAAEARWRASWSADAAIVIPDDLADLAQRLFISKGGKKPWRPWSFEPEWITACERIQEAAASASLQSPDRPWHPATYIRAQVDTIGWWCIQQGFSLRASMLTTTAARDRFERWCARNALASGDARRDHALEDARRKLISGEGAFAELALTTDDPLDELASEVAVSFPSWSLTVTRARDDVRLMGLVAGLGTLDPSYPTRVIAPPWPWKWGPVRRAIAALYRDPRPPRRQPVDSDVHDPDLILPP